MQTILLIGEDAMLLQTRAAVLRKVGAEILMTNAAHGLAVLAERIANLVVLCHSLSEEKGYALATAIRQRWPQTRILRITAQRDCSCMDEHMPVDATSASDPERLIACSIRLLAQTSPMRNLVTEELREARA